MEIYAKVITDSVSEAGVRISSVELQFPRFVLPQILMHRLWSRSCESLRARPTKSKVAEVEATPYCPVFRKNQKGMVAGEPLDYYSSVTAEQIWNRAAAEAAKTAAELAAIGVAKETANRLLEPFAYQKMLVTATDFSNFLRLRLADDAQPEIQQLAICLKNALDSSIPEYVTINEWHLPYVPPELTYEYSPEQLRDICAARCARVSYCTHDGTVDVAKDFALARKLAEDFHTNAFEHAATPSIDESKRYANYKGWVSSRYDMERKGLLPKAEG